MNRADAYAAHVYLQTIGKLGADLAGRDMLFTLINTLNPEFELDKRRQKRIEQELQELAVECRDFVNSGKSIFVELFGSDEIQDD